MGNRRNQSKLPLLDIVTYKLLSMQTFNLASCFDKSFILVCGSCNRLKDNLEKVLGELEKL